LAQRLALLFGLTALLCAQTPENVLVVVNQASPLSQQIGQYYASRRHIPALNLCRINTKPDEEISRDTYNAQVAEPIGAYVRAHRLIEQILYIVTTDGVPLKIRGNTGLAGEAASVDSELTLLYSDLHGHPHPIPGGIANPFFRKVYSQFRHPDFPVYLVTRLAGFDFDDVKGIIDRAAVARNRGKFVIDLKAADTTQGNRWLLEAARALPANRVVLDQSAGVLYNQVDVIGYASWGSNDPARKQRHLGFRWLPGAIMTEYVSSNGRSFVRPPDSWKLGVSLPKIPFDGSAQSLTADYIHDGVTGASGHVYEPFLQATPRPNILLPAYYHGRNLAESYYLAIPMVSWMNIVVGDPLCSLGKP
jgi:uncharacterized protein (TIGR03790 family)